MVSDRPTKRIEKQPSHTYMVNRRETLQLEPTEDGVVIKLGERSLALTRREALDLTLALVELTQQT